jgi:hypothetical protein
MKRYSMGFFKGAPAMFEQPDGEYVKWSDVQFLPTVTFGPVPPKGPCMVCGKAIEQHGSYPTCADHPYTASGSAVADGMSPNRQEPK